MKENQDSGRETDPQRPGSNPDGSRSTEQYWSAAPARNTERGSASSWVDWRSALYVFVLGVVCLVLAPLTSLWWIVPLLGAAAPIALAALDKPILASGRLDHKKSKEQELLKELGERGELTPTTAAMRTSLTVDEASKMLEELARKGHLELEVDRGVMAYALRGRDRGEAQSTGSGFSGAETGEASNREATSHTLEDSLSERELEVLALLASGRTNSEIARDLFVSVGTVKSHTSNIYRKLEAKNRTEALARAREHGLIG